MASRIVNADAKPEQSVLFVCHTGNHYDLMIETRSGSVARTTMVEELGQCGYSNAVCAAHVLAESLGIDAIQDWS
jgi:hypothetical protein